MNNSEQRKRYLVTESQMQKIFEHKLYTLLVNELETKDDDVARRMSKKQLINMMSDRNHGEDIEIVKPSAPSPERKKIIQLKQDQLNRMILTILLDNNAVLHGNSTDGHVI